MLKNVLGSALDSHCYFDSTYVSIQHIQALYNNRCVPQSVQVSGLYCVVSFFYTHPVDISQGALHCCAGIKIHPRLYLL